MTRRASALLILGCLLYATLAAPAAAVGEEVRRMEAVGAFPIDPARPSTGAPRDAAVRAAVRDAVLRIARALLPADFRPPGPMGQAKKDAAKGGEPVGALEEPPEAAPDDLALGAWLDEALGEDPFEFANRYRVLEDRGVRPALLSGASNVEKEYVVVVEVFVDVGRVLERLRAGGAIFAPSGETAHFRVWLVAEGIESFPAFDALRRTLLATPGVRAALPTELRRGRAEFAIDAEREASAVLDDLLTVAPSALQIIPLESQDDRLTVLVDWRAPDSPETQAPADPARDASPRD